MSNVRCTLSWLVDPSSSCSRIEAERRLQQRHVSSPNSRRLPSGPNRTTAHRGDIVVRRRFPRPRARATLHFSPLPRSPLVGTRSPRRWGGNISAPAVATSASDALNYRQQSPSHRSRPRSPSQRRETKRLRVRPPVSRRRRQLKLSSPVSSSRSPSAHSMSHDRIMCRIRPRTPYARSRTAR